MVFKVGHQIMGMCVLFSSQSFCVSTLWICVRTGRFCVLFNLGEIHINMGHSPTAVCVCYLVKRGTVLVNAGPTRWLFHLESDLILPVCVPTEKLSALTR